MVKQPAKRPAKKVAKKKAKAPKSCCIFCNLWTPVSGRVLFTLDNDTSKGICEECIVYLHAKLQHIVEDVLVEALQSTKH